MQGAGNQTSDILRWYPILPIEGGPVEVDAWSIDIPKIGKLHVALTDKPGRSEEEGDLKAYVLGGELDGLAVNPLTLLSKGYRTLNFIFEPIVNKKNQMASLHSVSSVSIYEGVFERSETDHKVMVPSHFWIKIPEKESDQLIGREVMVLPGEELHKIQIHFEGGEN